MEPVSEFLDQQGDLRLVRRVKLAQLQKEPLGSGRKAPDQLVQKGIPLGGGRRGKRFHRLRLPVMTLQIAQDGEEAEPLAHAEQTGLVGRFLLQGPLHSRQTEPLTGNVRQLIGVTFQREKRRRIGWGDIAKNHRAGSRMGSGPLRKSGGLGAMNPAPVTLRIQWGELGRGERLEACAKVAHCGRELELRPDQQAPDKVSRGSRH